MQASKLHLQRQMTGGNKGLNTWRTRRQRHPSPPPAPTTSYPLPVTHLTTTNRCLSLSSWLPSLTPLPSSLCVVPLSFCMQMSVACRRIECAAGWGAGRGCQLVCTVEGKAKPSGNPQVAKANVVLSWEILEKFSSVFRGGKHVKIY